jgi:uncharacterized protein YggU (UPF0235/DUF167 family)
MAGRLRIAGGVVSFQVRLTPKGGRDAVEGWDAASDGSEHLKCRVRAVPENGKANTALIALLAATLGVPKSTISIVSGATSRLKRVEIAGNSPTLIARLEGVSQ